jgi:hypothetical protein
MHVGAKIEFPFTRASVLVHQLRQREVGGQTRHEIEHVESDLCQVRLIGQSRHGKS